MKTVISLSSGKKPKVTVDALTMQSITKPKKGAKPKRPASKIVDTPTQGAVPVKPVVSRKEKPVKVNNVDYGTYAVKRSQVIAVMRPDRKSRVGVLEIHDTLSNLTQGSIAEIESAGLDKKLVGTMKKLLSDAKPFWLAFGYEAESLVVLNSAPKKLRGAPVDSRDFEYDTLLLDPSGADLLLFVLDH